MREILFRGKLISTGEWSEGNVYISKHGVCVITPDETPVGKYGQVDPETVGQYTGLTDKNGKKIFEGDILSVNVREYEETEDNVFGSRKGITGRKIKTVWTVEYKERFSQGNGFYAYGTNRRFNTFLSSSTLVNVDAEIIGNIHDNPELLKAGDDNG